MKRFPNQINTSISSVKVARKKKIGESRKNMKKSWKQGFFFFVIKIHDSQNVDV